MPPNLVSRRVAVASWTVLFQDVSCRLDERTPPSPCSLRRGFGKGRFLLKTPFRGWTCRCHGLIRGSDEGSRSENGACVPDESRRKIPERCQREWHGSFDCARSPAELCPEESEREGKREAGLNSAHTGAKITAARIDAYHVPSIQYTINAMRVKF